ncbi:MAG: IS66 family insertion sequence element accessory protein TnpB [Paracoccaceae bacterium]|nr:IS66 family insertion sequence element accessory protein TnpB [Paracoccaceae bacterium]
MTTIVSSPAVDGSGRKLRSKAEWRALMADFERWDGTQSSFCKAPGGVAEVVPELAPQARPHRRIGRRHARRLCRNRGGVRTGLGCRAVARRRGRAPSAAVLMLGGWPACGIWLSTDPADMRHSFDGLCALVSSHLGCNPADGRWYVFVNRRETDS